MKDEKLNEILWKLEGLQTVETAMEILGMKRQSTINLISRLKKKGYVTARGGGKKIRLYKITQRKQRKREKGMFDVLNKYNPDFKLNEWYDHQVHGKYTVEDAIVDAIETKSFRANLATLRLFNHVTDWPKLYRLSKERGCWQKIGALYDVSRIYYKAIKMPLRYEDKKYRKKLYLVRDYETKEERFAPIAKKWNVSIPFKEGDIHKVAA